jgi:opacity protein-like surface antigen
MKRIILIPVMLFLLASASYSQEGELQYYKDNDIKTLMGKEGYHGKYGSISVGYSGIDSRQTIVFGQKITWLPVRMLGIGMGFNEFISEYRHDDLSGLDIFVMGGYGGMYIEPIVLPRWPVHASFPLLMGFGGMSQMYSDDDFLFSNMFDEFQTFLILEPGAEVELNMTRSMRLSAGVTYRFTTPFAFSSPASGDVDLESLSSFTFKLVFKFGRF